MNHRDRIKQIIEDYPKLYSQVISKDPDLLNELRYHDHTDISISELVYRYLNNISQTVCEYGQPKKFKSLKDGYGFCGRAGTCKCAKASVSDNVKNAKQQISKKQQQQINAKRVATNLKKYGVENTAQTHEARNKHKQVYLDTARNQEITQKIKRTKAETYGNPNYNNSDKIKKTWNQNKQQYFAERYPGKDLARLYDANQLEKLFAEHTPYEIADITNTCSTTVFRYLAMHGLRSPYVSTLKQEMIMFLRDIDINNIVCNSRSVLPSRRELDIYLPDHNIAVEMNGIYWHHEEIPHIHKHYHREKFLECEHLGIQLITVFSDDWEQRKSVVKNLLAHKLMKTDIKYSARKLKICELAAANTRNFLNQYHIQGYAPASVCYGLFDKQEMVAVMTFSKPRSGIGKHRENTYELVRYASLGCVRGGASKLLKHFMKNHPSVKSIVSYSNNEYSQGNLYRMLGFQLESDLLPSYFYFCTKENRRFHRYNFAKHKLIQQGFDSNKTETQIQTERGYLKIWDTGKRTWVLPVNINQ